MAILGTGWGTRVQVPAFRHAGLQVTALLARTEAKAAAAAAEAGIPFGMRALAVCTDCRVGQTSHEALTHTLVPPSALDPSVASTLRMRA